MLALAILLSALLIGMSAVAVAATHNVSPGDDIQGVIDAASPGNMRMANVEIRDAWTHEMVFDDIVRWC